MKWISEEDLKKHIIRDNCDEGCGYIDERDIIDMEWVEDDEFIPLSVIGLVLDKIRAEIEALIEWHDCPIEYDNGNDAWYREACNQALKIIDKYKAKSEVQDERD